MPKQRQSRKRSLSNLRRRQPVREPYERVLIACEGSKTEPKYLRELTRDIGLNPANVVVIGDGGSAPESVVQTAIDEFDADKDFDRVYCVFDRDEHVHYLDAIQRIRDKRLRRPGRSDAIFTAITSVPCFEYWLILHFRYTDAPIERTGRASGAEMALRTLRGLLPGYRKGSDSIFDQTRDRLDVAIINAARVHDEIERRGDNNPSTRMHELVTFLRQVDRPE